VNTGVVARQAALTGKAIFEHVRGLTQGHI
jgi:hypothetical protein